MLSVPVTHTHTIMIKEVGVVYINMYSFLHVNNTSIKVKKNNLYPEGTI